MLFLRPEKNHTRRLICSVARNDSESCLRDHDQDQLLCRVEIAVVVPFANGGALIAQES